MLLLVKLGPGIRLPFAFEDDNPELLGYLLRATDDRADFLGQMVDVLSMLEELVVLGMGEQLRARVLFMFEDQTTANRMNVKTVINNRAKFGLELVVVDRLVAGDVDLQLRWFRSRESIHRQGTQPQGTDDLVAVRYGCHSHGHGVADGFEIAQGFFPQVFVQLVGHGVQQGSHAALLVRQREIGGGDNRVRGMVILVQVHENFDKVACFLGISGNEDLIVEKF